MMMMIDGDRIRRYYDGRHSSNSKDHSHVPAPTRHLADGLGRKSKLSARERRLLDAIFETPGAGEGSELRVLPEPQAGKARIHAR